MANTASKPGSFGVAVGAAVAGTGVDGVVVTGVDFRGVAVGVAVGVTAGVDVGVGVDVGEVAVGVVCGDVGVSGGPALAVNIPLSTVCAIGLLPVLTNFLTVRFSSLVSSALPVAFRVT